MQLDKWMQNRLKEESTPAPKALVMDSTWTVLGKSEKDSKSLISQMVLDAAPNHEQWEGKIDPTHNADYSKFQKYTSQAPDLDASSTFSDAGHKMGCMGKVINSMGDDTYMLKPYHNDQQYATGWNTMTTNKLYHSAGMGHMIEDIAPTSIKHEGVDVPVIASKFHKNHTVAENHKPTVSMYDASRLGLMDYLTDNTDRHSENLLMSDDLNNDGYHGIVAIDHDFTFDYGNTDPSPRSHPGEGYGVGAFGDWIDENDMTPKDVAKMADWWSNHASDIKESFNNSLGAISDTKMRDHLRENFTARHQALGRWASKAQDAKLHDKEDHLEVTTHNPFGHGMDDVEVNTPSETLEMDHIMRFKELAEEDYKGTLTGLISDKTDYTSNDGSILADSVFRHGDMKPSEWVDTLKQSSSTDFARAFKSGLINSLIKDKSTIALNYILEANKKQPFLTPMMAHHIGHNLEKK